jgi:hypothetical protein
VGLLSGAQARQRHSGLKQGVRFALGLASSPDAQALDHDLAVTLGPIAAQGAVPVANEVLQLMRVALLQNKL